MGQPTGDDTFAEARNRLPDVGTGVAEPGGWVVHEAGQLGPKVATLDRHPELLSPRRVVGHQAF